MALPQRDKLIAEAHGEWERLEELKAKLKVLIDRMS